MAKEFGIKFETLKGFKLRMEIDHNAIWWHYQTEAGKMQEYEAKCFYMAKESEEIFNVGSDDMVIITEDNKRQIIMRDNKNFLACEVEK